MAVDALDIVAEMALLARRLARNDPQHLQISLGKFVVVGVRALVRLAGVQVAAARADVVLVARLQLLDALDFVAVILEDVVQTLAEFVALDRIRRCGSGSRAEVNECLSGLLAGNLCRCC